MVTLKDIAARCNLSIATVSKALNNMPDISQATIARIQAVAREMGYLPNAAARTMKTGRSMTIGLLWFFQKDNLWESEHFAKIAASIQSAVEPKGYDITPVNCNGATMMGSWLNYCRYRNYDGLILLSGTKHNAALDELLSSDYPIVSIDTLYDDIPCVMTDAKAGIAALVDYAYSKGHRSFAYIRGENCLITRLRHEGFKEALAAHGLTLKSEFDLQAIFHDPVSTTAAADTIMAHDEKPTCIFYPDDYTAIAGINHFTEKGLKVPEDISIIGYDGIRSAGMIKPKLTTFRQDCGAIGTNAAELLLKCIADGKEGNCKHVTLPGLVVEGETVADINMA